MYVNSQVGVCICWKYSRRCNLNFPTHTGLGVTHNGSLMEAGGEN